MIHPGHCPKTFARWLEFEAARAGDASQQRCGLLTTPTALAEAVEVAEKAVVEAEREVANAAEARAMDPQQRLLLEAGYEATHGAALRRIELLGRDVGVFVGLMNTDFAAIGDGDAGRTLQRGGLSIIAGLEDGCVAFSQISSSLLSAWPDAAAAGCPAATTPGTTSSSTSSFSRVGR